MKQTQKKKKNVGAYFLVILIPVLITLILIARSNTSGNVGALNGSINSSFGDDRVELIFFYLKTCPHCHEEIKFQDEVLSVKYPYLDIKRYEVGNFDGIKVYKQLAKNNSKLDVNNVMVPVTIVGAQTYLGFNTPEDSGKVIIEMIEAEYARILKTWDNSTMKTTAQVRAEN